MWSRTRAWLGIAVMLGLPLAILVSLRVITHLDARFFSPYGHLVFVGGIAVLAAVVALIAALNARKVAHPGITCLCIGTAGVGVLMLGHGLTTPGVLSQPPNPWVGRFPHMAMALFAAMLFLAGRRVDKRAGRWVSRHSNLLVASSLTILTAVTAAISADPSLLPPTSAEENVFDVVSVVVVGLCLAVVVRHWHRFRLGGDAVQAALSFAAAMSIAATMSFQHGRFQQLSWWDYHAYLLAAFGCAVFAIAARSRRHSRMTEALDTAFDDDPFSHIEDGYPAALLHLAKAVEIKDRYTHGHSQRTAQVATQIGIRMGLGPDRLRVIARGAYLHDIGKIGIPDHILNKPGRLTDEERSVIETHPTLGYEMAQTAPTLKEALGVILYHHERFDGDGYPHGLDGTNIPLEARVVAVADVWDALTTDRSYRKGWPAEEALAHIVAGKRSHFDPAAVDALVDLAAEWGVRLGDGAGRPEEAWEAVQTCHQTPDDAELVGV